MRLGRACRIASEGYFDVDEGDAGECLYLGQLWLVLFLYWRCEIPTAFILV
jgi:hypothetical protein